jgi:phosphate transport system substrate-binding protein
MSRLYNLLKSINFFLCPMLILLSTNASADELNNLPNYEPSKLESGSLSSVGSDSMQDLVNRWVELYKTYQPDVTINIQSRGSASAAAALINGMADLGPMARPMKSPEVEDFRLKYGFEPTQVRTSIASISVYVSKNNPITNISLKELDAIFSETKFRGSKAQLNDWSTLGLRGSFARADLMPVGRVLDSYPHAYFRQRVLLQGKFNDKVLSTASMPAMIETIAANPGAIGYGETGFANEHVKELGIANEPGAEAVLPLIDNILTESYPLGRFLNVYIAREPGESLDNTTRDFLSFILSKQGQEVVKQQGLIPLPANIVLEERAKLL